MYPYNHKYGQTIQTDAEGVSTDRGFLAHFKVNATDATAADTDGIHLAVADTGVQQEITDGIIQPSVPRNITATAGGTATDIGAIQVTIEGTNFAGEVITETLPAFTLDTAGTVSGNKAFKTVTKITIPAHSGLGATTAIGFAEKLGLPYLLTHNTVLFAHKNDVKEATAPTVSVSPTSLEDNTFDLNSSLNGTKVDLYLIV
jgi:hypothetical protein